MKVFECTQFSFILVFLQQVIIHVFFMERLEEVGGATEGFRRLPLDEAHRRRDLTTPTTPPYSPSLIHFISQSSESRALSLLWSNHTRRRPTGT